MERIAADVGDTLDDIDTPALVVDLDAFERNVARMAESSCFSQGCNTVLGQLVTPVTRTCPSAG